MKKLITLFATLENDINKFCREFREELLRKLQQSDVLVTTIDQFHHEQASREILRDLFDLTDGSHDSDIARINAAQYTESADLPRNQQQRDTQAFLSNTVISTLSRNEGLMQRLPPLADSLFLVGTFYAINLNSVYQQTVKKLITLKEKPDVCQGICDSFIGMGLVFMASHIRSKRDKFNRLLGSKFMKRMDKLLTKIEKNVGTLTENLQRVTIDFTLLDVLIERYMLDNSAGIREDLMRQYQTEDFATKWSRYQDLLHERDSISAAIKQLRVQAQDYYQRNARRGVTTEAPQEAEIRRLQEIRRELLIAFKQTIIQCVEPFTRDLEENPHYNSEAKFYYALMLLKEEHPDYVFVEYHLGEYVHNSPKRAINELLANGLLYMLNARANVSDDDTLVHYACTAAMLEETNIPEACGFGFYINALHGFRCAAKTSTEYQNEESRLSRWYQEAKDESQWQAVVALSRQIAPLKSAPESKIENEVKPMLFAAAERGFDFRPFVMRVQAGENIHQVLLDVRMAANLTSIEPDISRQYAEQLLSLMRQELHIPAPRPVQELSSNSAGMFHHAPDGGADNGAHAYAASASRQ